MLAILTTILTTFGHVQRRFQLSVYEVNSGFAWVSWQNRGSTPLASSLRAQRSGERRLSRQLLRARFQPLAPKLRPTIRISVSVVIERANKRDSVVGVWSPPVPRLSRTEHVVVVP